MDAFLRLHFFLFVLFPALIGGKTEIDREEYVSDKFFLRNYHSEEDVDNFDRSTSPPELGSSRPKGNFFIYTPENPKGVEFFFDVKSHHFKNNTPTKIITHGYSDKKKGLLRIVKEYLRSGKEVNVLAYFWQFNSGLPYSYAARLCEHLGKKIGSDISKLYKYYELKPEHVHLIGYNLGAHLFGAAGREQHHKIGRITGLDPARRCFEVYYKNIKLTPLSKKDARFVDVVHTNAKGEGVFEPYGTADFYPNGGIVQPQCEDNSKLKKCSSILSYFYFIESIRNREHIWARKCSNYEEFLSKKCEKNPQVLFGEFVNSTAEGSYFFEPRMKHHTPGE